MITNKVLEMLSKAFDTLALDIVLGKLIHYGLEGVTLALFKDYLTNRKQYVEFNYVISETLDITTGVPQGYILGPLLFILYVDDFPQAVKYFHCITYAPLPVL